MELNHIAIYNSNLVFSCKAIIRCKNIPQFCQVWWHNLIIPAPEKLKQNGKEFEANLDCVESSRPPRQHVRSCLNVYPHPLTPSNICIPQSRYPFKLWCFKFKAINKIHKNVVV